MPRLACVRLVLLTGLLVAADWPSWRGPTRDGRVDEFSGFRDGKWISERPIWSANVGEGTTSPLLVGHRLYTLGHAEGRDSVWCLDAATGKEVWKASYRCPRHGRHHLGDEVFYAGPCSTPEYDAETGYLYTLSIDGDLACLDTARKGERVWGVNLYDRFGMPRRPKVGRGGQQRDYGYTTSPMRQGDWLLVEVGGKEGTVVAFDRKTGKIAWSSTCKDLAGHTGGMARMTVEGIPCLAVLTLENLVVIRLDRGREGQTLASYPWTTEWANNIASPAAVGDCVLVTSAYNKNAICKLRVSTKGITRLWQAPYPSKACTPVIHKGHVYFAWQKVRCLDLDTGKEQWSGGFVGDPGSCLVTRDDRLVVWGQNGRLLLVETASRAGGTYRELARVERVFDTLAWPHVALSGGRLVCKDRRGNVKCFAVPSLPR